MTAEMLEAFPALWAKEAILAEPGVNFRDRMKLIRAKMKLVNGFSLRCLNDIGAPVLVAQSEEFLFPKWLTFGASYSCAQSGILSKALFDQRAG
jgi:hypothetical protein